jgi:protein O-mannosyl-transferase
MLHASVLAKTSMHQTAMSSTSLLRIATFLFLICAIVYLPGLNAPFIFDDYLNLVNNAQITTLTPQPNSWRESRPIGFLSFALNYAIHGLHPLGFRLVNVVLHWLTATLLFAVVRNTLMRVTNSQQSLRNEAIATTVALLWMVHPLHCAAVTCIVQRFEIGMGLCFVLLIYCLERCCKSHSLYWQCAVWCCFFAGLGCKEVMVMALPVSLSYDRIFLANSWKEIWQQRGKMYVGLSACLVWLGWVISAAYAPGANATAGFGLQGVSAWEYLRSQPAVILYYLKLVFWPVTLCLDYGWPIETSVWHIYGGGLLIVALLLLSFIYVLKKPALGWLGLTFFLILAPTSSFMPIADLAFEHRMYLPLIPVIVLSVLVIDYILAYCLPRHKLLCLIAIMLLLQMPLAYRTMSRNREFCNPEKIWQGAIAMNPNFARSHFLLAEHYRRESQWQSAIKSYRTAITLRPSYVAAYANIALAYEQQHMLKEAQAALHDAMKMDPADVRLPYKLGNLLARHEQWLQAEAAFRLALKINPKFEPAQQSLKLVQQKQDSQAEKVP